MAIVIDQNWILHKTSNISCFWHVLTKKTFFGANCTPKRHFARIVLQIMFLSSNEQIVHQNGFSPECYYKSFISIITSTERRMAIVIDQNWILHKTSNISCFWHVLTKKTFFGANCTPKRYFARMVLQIMFLSSNEQIVHQNGFSPECYYKSFISIITYLLSLPLTHCPKGVGGGWGGGGGRGGSMNGKGREGRNSATAQGRSHRSRTVREVG